MFKKIILVLTTLLALVGIALLALLLPAHLAIRDMAINIPEQAQIRAVFSEQEQASYPSRIIYVNTATQDTPIGTLGHVGVLIEWPDGKQFLIDAGMNEQEALAFGKPFELLGAGPTTSFGAIDKQLGEHLEQIKGIGFTHLHSDHTQGVSAICDSLEEVASIFQIPEQARLHNYLTQAGQDLINDSSCNKHVLDDTLLKAVPGFPGLFVLAAGGHTPGSSIFITQLNGKFWIFAGDISNVMENLYHNKGKGWLYSNLLVPEDTVLLRSWRVCLSALDQQEDMQVLVAHDIRAFEASELQSVREALENQGSTE